jgi:hypothetical protein
MEVILIRLLNLNKKIVGMAIAFISPNSFVYSKTLIKEKYHA